MIVKHNKLITSILNDYKDGKASLKDCLQGIQNIIGEAIELGVEEGKEYDVDISEPLIQAPVSLDVISTDKGKISKEMPL